MGLTHERRGGTVIQEVTDAEILGPGMESQSGPGLGDNHRLIDAIDGAVSGLQDRAGLRESLDETAGRAVEARRFGSVEFDIAIVDAQAGQGRQDVLHQADLAGRIAQGGPAFRAADLLNSGGQKDRWG